MFVLGSFTHQKEMFKNIFNGDNVGVDAARPRKKI